MRRGVSIASWSIGLIVLGLGLGFDDPAASSVQIKLDPPSNSHPVVAGAAVIPARVRAGGTITFVVKAKTAPTWHIYAADGPTGGSIPTTLKLKLPKGVAAKDDWVYPAPTQIPGGEAWIYEGEMVFKRTLRLGPDVPSGPIEINCEFGYQACDPLSCRPPAKLNLKTKAEVVSTP